MTWRYAYTEILHGKTVNRVLLHAGLRELFEIHPELSGEKKILELGNRPASHQRAYPKEWNLETSDIESHPDAEHVIDVDKRFPISDGAYEGVVYFNVVPMIVEIDNCFRESLRVARSFVIFNSPLISGMARDPLDMNRFTRDRLEYILERYCKEGLLTEYNIIGLGGSFSSALTAVTIYVRWKIFLIPFNTLALVLDRLDRLTARECPGQYLVLIKK